MKPLALLALALPLVALSPRPADACSFAANGEHALDPAFASDTTPPSAVTASARIQRFINDGNSCFDIAYINLDVAATDDAAPPERLGYQLRLVSGELPSGLELPAVAPTLEYNNSILLFFDYRDRDGFSFELEIRAIDLNGNLGPPTVLVIEETSEEAEEFYDDGGCSTAGTSSTSLLALLALAFVRRRRR